MVRRLMVLFKNMCGQQILEFILIDSGWLTKQAAAQLSSPMPKSSTQHHCELVVGTSQPIALAVIFWHNGSRLYVFFVSEAVIL